MTIYDIAQCTVLVDQELRQETESCGGFCIHCEKFFHNYETE